MSQVFTGRAVMKELYRKAASIIKNSKTLIALTGAGHSVESGIPDFRSPGGLWEQFDPEEYAHINAFKKNPEKIWNMIFALREITDNAKYNAAHKALAQMEEKGFLKAVITQNIDNLHQQAGSKNVIEFHGNATRYECMKCGTEYRTEEISIKNKKPPKCKKCKFILKPGFVFFGEMIPPGALSESQRLASVADAILVIGTSAVVYPAASIPFAAKRNGAKVIELNREKTGLTSSITDVFIEGLVGTTLPKLLEHVESI
ncbi:MAG: NAD-dependent deacylase [Spirochaetes bacterium]|nr:NAD-dependent deacylase [Spirochaetota bacterium]